MVKIRCLYDALVDPNTLTDHVNNANYHPQEQIERLAKILEYQGFRYPIKISKQTGMITSGHGRKLAAIRIGLKEVPVVYQDYTDKEQEYADLTADNAIALWAELDFSSINSILPELGPDFDIDLLGLKDFSLDPWESDIDALNKVEGNLDGITATIKINCPQESKQEIIEIVKKQLADFEGVEVV